MIKASNVTLIGLQLLSTIYKEQNKKRHFYLFDDKTPVVQLDNALFATTWHMHSIRHQNTYYSNIYDLRNYFAARTQGAYYTVLGNNTSMLPRLAYFKKRFDKNIFIETTGRFTNNGYSRLSQLTWTALLRRGLLYFGTIASTIDNSDYSSISHNSSYSKYVTLTLLTAPLISPAISELLQLDTLADMYLSPDASNNKLGRYIASSQKLLNDFFPEESWEDRTNAFLAMPGIMDAQLQAHLPILKQEIQQLGFKAFAERAVLQWNYYGFHKDLNLDYSEFLDWCENNADDFEKNKLMLFLSEEEKRFNNNNQFTNNGIY